MSSNPFEPNNPFEAPREDVAPSAFAGEAGTLDIALALRDGWDAMTTYLGPWVLVGTVGSLVALLSAATVIGAFIVVPVLFWGGVKFTLNTVDGGAKFGDLFSGFSFFGGALVGMWGLFLANFVLGLPGQVFSWGAALADAGALLIAVGYLISIAWTFAIMVRFYFAPFYLVDQGMGVVESFRASWEATRHQKLNVLLMALVSAVVTVAGLLFLIIGVVFAAMVVYAAWASAYRQLSGTRGRHAETV